MREIEIGKEYRDFKGQIYKIYSLTTAEKSQEQGDIFYGGDSYPESEYKALCESQINKGEDTVIYYRNLGTGRLYWARSLSNFVETLEIKRFTRSLVMNIEVMSNNEQVQIGKKYRHFNNGQIYKVYAIEVATKNYRKDDLVCPSTPYNAWTAFTNIPFNAWAASPISEGNTIVFYTKESGSGQLCWARSLHNFAETLEIKRFTEIEE